MNKTELQKEQKKIRNRRTGRTRLILGWACLIVGVLDLFSNIHMFSYSLVQGLQVTILPLIMACFGGWLVKSTKKDVVKWDKYDALINQNGNTSLRMIARKTGWSVDKVRSDIQTMINNGFFNDEYGNIGAYINGEYDILVMTRNGEPLEPVEETARREEEEANISAQANSAEAYADLLELAVEKMPDPDIAQSLKSIVKSIRKIDRQVKRNPELEKNDSVRQLREIYLPKTVELVDKIRHGDAGADTMLEIKGMLNTCAVAYGNIVDKLTRREDEDTLIDIEVLQQTFAKEGLLGSDFDIK